jgi:hypothetical protein
LNTPEWYERFLENNTVFNSDYTNAFDVAGAVTSTVRGRYALLGRVARWADDVMSQPRVWRVITTLAKAIPPGGSIRKDRALRVMYDAWGDLSCGVPVLSLGELRWGKRLLGYAPPPSTPEYELWLESSHARKARKKNQ